MKRLSATGPDEDGHSSLRFSWREGRAPCPGDLWCAEPDRSGKSGEGDCSSSLHEDKSRMKKEEREKRQDACPQKAVPTPMASHSDNPQFSTLETEALRGMTELSYSKWCALPNGSQDEDRVFSFFGNHHPAVPEDYRERTSGTDFLPHSSSTWNCV